MRIILSQYLLLFSSYLFGQGQVSPDGKLIVDYEKVDSINTEIFVFKLDGANRIRITNNPYPDYNPEWLPNGKEVVFYRKHLAKDQADIFIVSIDGSNERSLTTSIYYNSDPSYSSMGDYFAFGSNRDGDHEIYISSKDEKSLKQLTYNHYNDWTPTWSPDDKEISFASDRTGNFEIYKMKSDGSNIKQLTNSETESYCPDWSPDGSQIAYFRRDSSEAKFDIYMVSNKTGEVLNLTQTNEWNEFIIGWTPDSNKVVFSCEQHHGICSIEIENKTTEILMKREN